MAIGARAFVRASVRGLVAIEFDDDLAQSIASRGKVKRTRTDFAEEVFAVAQRGVEWFGPA
ncbi:MAG: hypothetical protein HY508_03755 [Acidobacteria bacterium]|nr:hypothetical protein [Acidobacteriota bacterium]